MKKISSWLFLSILIVSLFGVSAVGVFGASPYAGRPGPSSPSASTNIFGQAFDKIVSIGSLEFLLGTGADSKFIGFLRILIAILVFCVFYAGANAAGQFIPRQAGITISVILAILTSVFIPGSVLAAIGSGYAVLVSSLLIGVPVFALMYFIFGTQNTRFMAGTKIVLLFLVWYVLIEVAYWASYVVV